VKSGCAREWGGWGRLSEDGLGQHNPVRSEGPWGRAAESARTEVFHKRIVPDSAQGITMAAESTKGDGKPSTGKAAPEISGLEAVPGKTRRTEF